MRNILLSIVLLLGATQSAYSISRGAPPDRNGLNGQFCTACHRTNVLNSPGGSVSVSGMPSAWIPGQVYALRVMIVREGSARWGFEMSAVDASGQQAGEFIAGPDGRSQVVTAADVNGRQIQFITHTSVGTGPGRTNIFEISYRAPSNAGLGDIRFNLAGNAANGNNANTGDFIYAIQTVIPVAITSSRSFNIAARGAASMTTDGRGSSTVTGHARLQGGGGGAPPAALALLAFRPGGILVSEAAISAAPAIQSGRFYVEVGNGVNTGIAIANPGSQAATVNYFLSGAAGNQIHSGSVAIPANGQIAAFIDQPKFYTPGPFRPPITDARSMTFTSSVPIAVLAIRGRTNERSEFLVSPLPVSDLSASTTESAYIPDFADGDGWSTQVALTNTSDEVMTGSVQFFGPGGQGLTLTVDGQSGTRFDYSIPARTSRRLQTSGSATTTTLGSIRVSPASGSRTPAAFAILTSRRNNVAVSEISIPAVRPGSAFRMYVENSGSFSTQQAGSLQTAFAAVNPSSSAITLSLELTGLDGTTSFAGSVSIPAQGQIATFVNQVVGFSSLPNSFQGVLRVSASASSGVSIVGLRGRYNERAPASDFVLSSVPATDDTAPPSSADLVFPHIADSGGYTTQFVLLNGSTGASSGMLRLFDPSGSSLTLTLR
jgi:hypothetical protein